MFSASLHQLSVLSLLVAFSSMAYELVIAQTISLLTDDLIWWESLTIGTFILGTGVGILNYGNIQKQSDLSLFRQAEYILACLGLLVLPLILCVHIVYRIYMLDYQMHAPWASPLNWALLFCEGPTFLIGILAGIELSALLKMLPSGNFHTQIFVIAFYHFGALVASLVFAVFAWTKVDAFYLVCVASFLNACIFVFLRPSFFPTSVFISLFILSSSSWSYLKDLQLKNFYYNSFQGISTNGIFQQTGPVGLMSLLPWAQSLPSIERRTSSHQVIDFVRSEDDASQWKLFLDGHMQFATENELYYHEFMAHVPIMLTRKVPKDVLVLGGGDGLLMRELLNYGAKIQRLDLVELDREMTKIAQNPPLRDLNAGSLVDPKPQIHIADAFSWLRSNRIRYTAIYIDFPYPYTFEGLRLYSAEFFHWVSKGLDPDGFVMMDVPLFEAGAAEWQSHIQGLLSQAGFAKVLALHGAYGETFVAAWKSSQMLSYAYWDVGFSLQTLDETWFAKSGNILEIDEQTSRVATNSILKPRRIAVRDLWK